MKIQSCLFSAALLAGATLAGAPLMETTAIHSQPDSAAPAIGYLKAGTEPTPAANVTAPDGWMAVTLPGPFEAFVANDDLSKDLVVHPGAALRQQPKSDGPVLTTMQDGDPIEITGLRPGWTQVKLSRDIVGYIKVGGPAAAGAATVPPPPPASAIPPPPAPAPGFSAPAPSPGPIGLPHTYQGMLTATHRLLLIGPRPDYDYELDNLDGKLLAYLDVSGIQATVKLETLVGKPVTVQGVLRQATDGHNLVIEVVSLQVK
jgi:Bacterial SH3 domain